MSKTRIWGALTITLLATALVGCAQQYGPGGQGVSPVEVDLPRGGIVVCVLATSGGVDCDWEGVAQ